MKTVQYIHTARRALSAMSKSDRANVMADIEAYAAGEAGDALRLAGYEQKRLRSDPYRVIFLETARAITVTHIEDRDTIYRRFPRRH